MTTRSMLAVVGFVSCLLAVPANHLMAQQSVRHSAAGSGHIGVWEGMPDGNYWDSYSFTALTGADGRVSGQVQYSDKELLFFLHGKVFNLKVESNVAKIGWTWTHGQWPYPGFEDYRYVFFLAVDNGEGAGTMDMISWSIFANDEGAFGTSLEDLIAMTPAEFLAWLEAFGYDPPLFAYVNGNIQVR